MIKKGKTLTKLQIELNKKKLLFLNLHGVKVKVDGSWGPWLELHYNRLKKELPNWFSNAIIGGAVAENPAIATASGWKLDNMGNWGLERTKESDKLASNLAELSLMSPTNPGSVITDAVARKVVFPVIKTGYNIAKNLHSKGPLYIFDNINYNTLLDILLGLYKIGKAFKRNPLKVRPKYPKAARRTDVTYDSEYPTYSGNESDPLAQIRKRLNNRLLNRDYTYNPHQAGYGIDLSLNPNATADDLIAEIPTKSHLSLRDVWDLNARVGNNKLFNLVNTPITYFKVNTEPAFSFSLFSPFVKVNKKALRDLGLDYSTTLAHEYNHALRSRKVINGDHFKRAFNFDHLHPRSRDYLSNITEIEARGTLLKNYFDTDVITPDMLKYASLNYVKDTGFNNNMYLFFSGIKDWNEAADFISKYSLKNGGKL